MINKLHSLLHRPEKGWDPVPPGHAATYAKGEWEYSTNELTTYIETLIGGFDGKRVLDLGGGPGQYSVAFAKRGAHVTWHDVSRTYMEIARLAAAKEEVNIEFSLGYLEEAIRFIATPFDLIFNRICWCYCMNDSKFAHLVYLLVKPGGGCYIDSMKPIPEEINGDRRSVFMLNKYLGLKIGHPNPPLGRIGRLLHEYPMKKMILDYTSKTNERIYFIKSTS
jgi:SAM-dependent methyltransferase